MNYKKLPKSNEVQEFNIGNQKVKVVKITDENRAHILEIVMSAYLGDQCQFCLKTFDTLDDLRGSSVWAPWEHGRIAHKTCWDKNGGAS